MTRAFVVSFIAIAFSGVSLQAQSPQEWQAQLNRLRQQRQAPNIQWENTELSGSIKAISLPLVQVASGGGENWVVQLDGRPQDTVFQGPADPAFVKPGMLVEFKARLNKRGTASEPVSSLTIFTVREGRGVGVAPEGGGAKGEAELFTSKPDEPEKKGPKGKEEDPVYQVAGQITKLSRGEMTINCAGTTVKADLAKEAKVLVDVNHLLFAQAGDKVEVRARYPMGQKAAGQALATQITVIGSKPLGEIKKRVLPGTKPNEEEPKADEKKEYSRLKVVTTSQDDMLSNPELQHTLAAQPYLRMRLFAELLGWRGLQMFKLQDERIPGGLLVYFMTSDQKFNLQINAREQLSTTLFQACVVAERDRIVHTDWHPFELFADDNHLLAEAQRLRPFLVRQNFKDRAWRKAFAEQYPERIYPMHRRAKGK